MRPGLAPDVVRRGLVGFPIPSEIIDWFGWHDGPIGRALGVRLAPGHYEPLGLEAAFWAYGYLLCVAESLARELAIDPGTPDDPGYFWDKSWLPIADRSDLWLAADLGSGTDLVPVRMVVWDNDEFRTVRAGSLAEMVQLWLDVPDEAWWWDRDGGRWDGDPRLIPQELRKNPLV